MATTKNTKPYKVDVKAVIDTNYQINKLIGAGSFGEVYEAADKRNGKLVAIKVESPQRRRALLKFEAQVYQELFPTKGIPCVYNFKETELGSSMTLDLLGPSLEQLFNKHNRCFSVKTILMLGMQMVDCLQAVHKRGYIHRDIKPENFLIGRGPNRNVVYLADFGLAKRISANKTPRIKDTLTGTVLFASINCQNGVEQSCRDDLESLWYSLVYLSLGYLPWENVQCESTQDELEAIRDSKKNTPMKEVCRNLPWAVSSFIGHCRSLEFADTPNYDFLRTILSYSMLGRALDNDLIFDWIPLPKKSDQVADKRVLQKKQKR